MDEHFTVSCGCDRFIIKSNNNKNMDHKSNNVNFFLGVSLAPSQEKILKGMIAIIVCDILDISCSLDSPCDYRLCNHKHTGHHV